MGVLEAVESDMTAEDIRALHAAIDSLRTQLLARLDDLRTQVFSAIEDLREEAIASRERHHEAMNRITVAVGTLEIEAKAHAALPCHKGGEDRIARLESWRAYQAGGLAIASGIAGVALAVALKFIR